MKPALLRGDYVPCDGAVHPCHGVGLPLALDGGKPEVEYRASRCGYGEGLQVVLAYNKGLGCPALDALVDGDDGVWVCGLLGREGEDVKQNGCANDKGLLAAQAPGLLEGVGSGPAQVVGIGAVWFD